ncbi:MAG TPA: DUF2779 domain-containing protein [Steroidobacteraceae bacterium]|nr:DUF2779 domain-containing protein [Steroidobacteraceae bacterium]
MTWLTKSRFLSGRQCHKRLWFEIHQPLEQPVPPSVAILQGRVFDELVQRLEPGVVISRDRGMPAAIAATSKLLAKGADAPATLYQPAFRARDLAIIADVLRRRGDTFELVEVKATTQVKEWHRADAAFQALVLKGARIPVDRYFIGHVNNEFVLRRTGAYAGLIVEEDITGEVERTLAETAHRAHEYLEIMAGASMPAIAVGPQCHDPHPCPFFERCTAGQTLPEFPVGLLPRGGNTVEELVAEGYRDLREVPLARLTNEMHRRVHRATLSGAAYFDESASAELRQLPLPYAYLDFETIGFSVPEVIGTRPFEQLPFQWSVHVEHGPDDVRHAEYLAIESFGDFEALTRALVEAIPSQGTVFAYNASFEKRVLNQLAELVPAHATALHGLAERLFDLLPITRQAYYHRDMHGSWSIKSVVPTIALELRYEGLDEVQEGDGAQLAFLELRGRQLSPERDSARRSALLRYCAHDTWVMVVLRRFLCAEPLRLGDHYPAA